MKSVELQANIREGAGKAATKKVRLQKRIPAVVYGHQVKKPISVDFDYKQFETAIHTKAGENVLINLKISGKEKLDKTVIIKDIQHHPVTEKIEHVDLNVISLTEKIKVNVHVSVTGEAPGVKEGGVLDLVRHEIEIECLPTEIPERLGVKIDNLGIGDAIHIKDMTFPKGVTPLLEADEVVVAVHAPKEEVAATEEGAAPTEPEVIAKGKEDKEGEEGAAPKADAKKAEGKPEKAAEKTEKPAK